MKIDLKDQLIEMIKIVVSRLIFQIAHALLSFVMRNIQSRDGSIFPTYCLCEIEAPDWLTGDESS